MECRVDGVCRPLGFVAELRGIWEWVSHGSEVESRQSESSLASLSLHCGAGTKGQFSRN